MKTNTKIAVAAVVAIALVAVVSFSRNSTSEDKPTHVVVLIPETGPAAEYAKYSRMGFDLGIASAKAQGLAVPELIYADTRSNPKDALSALQQSLAVSSPSLVISLLSSVTKAIAPVAAEQGIPVIANAVAAPGLANPSQGLYRVFPTSDEVSALASSRLVELGAKNAIVVYVNDEYGIGCRQTFAEQASLSGLEVLASEPFEVVQKDFRNQWERLLEQNPDALFIAGYGPGYAAVLQQLAERSYTCLLYTSDAADE